MSSWRHQQTQRFGSCLRPLAGLSDRFWNCFWYPLVAVLLDCCSSQPSPTSPACAAIALFLADENAINDYQTAEFKSMASINLLNSVQVGSMRVCK